MAKDKYKPLVKHSKRRKELLSNSETSIIKKQNRKCNEALSADCRPKPLTPSLSRGVSGFGLPSERYAMRTVFVLGRVDGKDVILQMHLRKERDYQHAL